jgi:NAD(P)-dependent dehydrogenase (short-subunit alcohol dehydrogenase family)
MFRRQKGTGLVGDYRPASFFGARAALVFAFALVAAAVANPRGADAQAAPRADDRVILITGSTDGLGREVALELAGPGTHILVHGRNAERGAEVVSAIQQVGGSARFFRADLAELTEVRALGVAVLDSYDRLDILVNNAGIWLEPEQGRRTNAAGHEMHFAVNYLSHYLLTRILLPLITSTPNARIVNVASAAQQPIDFDDVMMENGYDDGRGYAQSKLAQVLFTIDLAEELRDTGVTVNALHPATMMNTSMVLSRGAATRSTVEEGVDAVLNLIEAPGLGSGGYFNGTRPVRAHAQAYDEDARARLRELSDRLTGAPGADR